MCYTFSYTRNAFNLWLPCLFVPGVVELERRGVFFAFVHLCCTNPSRLLASPTTKWKLVHFDKFTNHILQKMCDHLSTLGSVFLLFRTLGHLPCVVFPSLLLVVLVTSGTCCSWFLRVRDSALVLETLDLLRQQMRCGECFCDGAGEGRGVDARSQYV